MNIRVLLSFVPILFALGCGPQADPWTEEKFESYLRIMGDTGTNFAAHDVCMPMIAGDEDVRERVALEVGAKRFSELEAFDTEAEYDRLLNFFDRTGGTDEEIERLVEAYDASHQEAVDIIQTIEQCETTLIDFHNAILNTGVREL